MKPVIVLLALIGLIIHILYSGRLYQHQNEAILENAVEPAVVRHFDGVKIKYDYLDGTLEGRVASLEGKEAARKYAKNNRLAGRIINNIEVHEPKIVERSNHIPKKAPNVSLSRLLDGSINLIGSVPNTEIRSQIERAASRLSPGRVNSQSLVIDQNVTEPDWLIGLPSFVGTFFESNGGEEGKIEAGPQTLRLSRVMRNTTSKDALYNNAKSLGLPIVNDLSAPLSQKEGKLFAVLQNNTITVSGSVPTAALKNEIEQTLAAKDRKVINNLIVDEDINFPSWGKYPTYLRDFFKGTPWAELEIKDEKNVRLKRQVADLGSQNTWLSNSKTIFPGATIVNEIQIESRTTQLLPPREFSFKLKPIGRDFEIDGWLPTPALKSQIVSAAQAKFPGRKILADKLQVSPDIKMPEWGAALPEFIKGLDANLAREIPITNRGIDFTSFAGPERSKLEDLARRSISSRFPEFQTPEFGVNLKRQGKKFDLGGWLPSEDMKNRISRGLKNRYPDIEISDNIRIDPNISFPDWSKSLPDFVDSINNWQDISEIRFDSSGLKMPGVSTAGRTELEKLAAGTIGANYPSTFSVPKFGFDLKRSGDEIYLGGTLGDPSLKQRILTTLKRKLPNYKFTDRIDIDPNIVVPVWEMGIPKFFDSLININDVDQFSFDDKYFNMENFPADRRIEWEKIFQETLGTEYPNSFPRPQFGFTLERRDNKIQLSGHLTDPAAKSKIITELQRRFPNNQITDAIRINSNLPAPEWASSFPEFLSSIDDWSGVDKFGCNEKGLILDGVSVVRRAELDNRFLKIKRVEVAIPIVKAEPSKFLAKLSQGELVLTGQVPTDEVKLSLARAALAARPNLRITNQIEVNPKVEMPVWGKGLPSFVSEFFKGEGDVAELELEGDQCRIKQTVPSDSDKANFTRMARTLFPGGRIIDEVIIEIPPPIVTPVRAASVRIDMSPAQISMEGELPDNRSRDELLRGVRAAYPNAKLINNIQVSPEVFPTSWVSGLSDFLGEFPTRAKNGKLTIGKNSFEMSGEASGPTNHNRILARLARTLPKDFNISDLMKPGSPVPGVKEEKPFPNYVVYYDSGKSIIKTPGQKQVSDAVTMIKGVEGSPIVLIKGFADSRGDAAANQRLSAQRASGVVDSLVAQGIDKTIIRYIAVGESESNKVRTEKDRRVEIIITN